MSSVISKASDVCTVHKLLESVHTPNFPTADWVINPVLTNVRLPEITDVTAIADVAGTLGGTHFLINTDIPYYVWIDVDNLSVDPAPAGRVGIEVDIISNDGAGTVAAAIQTAVDAVTAFTATVSVNTVTITTSGPVDVTDAVDVDTGFTVTVTQQGINVPQIHWKVVGTSVLEKTVGEKSSTDICLFSEEIIISQIEDINTNLSGPVSFIEDKTRSFKTLSTNEFLLEFSKPTLGDQDWIAPQNRIDTGAAYTCPYDSTIVASALHVVDAASSTFNLEVYINGASSGVIATIGGVGEQSETNVVLDIDVAKGDLIKVRAVRTVGTGELIDPILKLFLKWRLV